jgi:hypothetical protein
MRRHTEARAVRKAVNVLAWRIPMGRPSGENRVIAPVGLTIGRLVSEGSWFEADESVITVM